MFSLWIWRAEPLALMIYRSKHSRTGPSRYHPAWILWLALLLSPPARAADFSPTLTNIAQLLALDGPRVEARPAARLKAVVTYYEPRRKLFVVQDQTGGIVVRTRHGELALARGQEVELDGVAGRYGSKVMLDQAVIRTVKEGRLPACIPTTIATVSRGQYDGLRVEIRGVVRLLDSNGARTVLHLHDGPADLDVLLRDTTRRELSPKTWVDAEVVVQGVPYTVTHDGDVPAGLYFLTDGLKDVHIEKPPLERPFSINAISIAQALQTNFSHRVKVMGRVTAPPDTDGWLTINDSTDAIRLRRADRSPVLAGDLVEALGFPDGQTGAAYIDHAQLRVLETSSRYKTAFTNDPALPAPPHLPVLFTITEARSLPLEKAKLGFPVRVRGVVTFQDREARYFFIHDGRQGVCVAPLADPGPLLPGEIVEVTGNSDVGAYAPTVVNAQIKRVARGELPVPREASLSEMMTGREDCQWVAVEGIVRDSRIYQKQLWIKLAVNGGIVSAMVPVPEGSDSLGHLVDAEIRLRAVCVAKVNERRQIVSPALFVPGMEFLTVKTASPPDPFAVPITHISDLFRFNPDGTPGHRVRVAGVVTHAKSPGQFFLRDETSGALIDLAGPLQLAPGDRVEVCGFPFRAEPAPHLKFALVRKVGSGSRPAPFDLDARAALNGSHDADLVRLRARLLEVSATGNNAVLVLNDRNLVFEAAGDTNLLTAFRTLQPGSLLQLTGICSVPSEESAVRRTLRLRIASAEDVVVLQSPHGPTLERALQLVALLGAIILVGALWGLTRMALR